MGRQLVTLALGLTILGLGRFNDQEIIISEKKYSFWMQRSKKCSPQDKQYNAVSRIKEILFSTLSLKRQFRANCCILWKVSHKNSISASPVASLYSSSKVWDDGRPEFTQTWGQLVNGLFTNCQPLICKLESIENVTTWANQNIEQLNLGQVLPDDFLLSKVSIWPWYPPKLSAWSSHRVSRMTWLTRITRTRWRPERLRSRSWPLPVLSPCPREWRSTWGTRWGCPALWIGEQYIVAIMFVLITFSVTIVHIKYICCVLSLDSRVLLCSGNDRTRFSQWLPKS